MNLLSEFDNKNNHRVESLVPERAKEESCLLGIDEAGRGPVLGPMVYGICYCPLSLKDDLKDMGFADSKTLTEEQRESLFEKLNAATEKLGWIVDILSPNYISNSMLRRCKYNLNQISHDTAIGLIRRALDQGVVVKEVYVDTVGDPAIYQDKLKRIFPDLEITVAKKADSTFPIVSAASICAKVARDRVVKSWRFIEGFELSNTDYGSGYPGDAKTKQFLIDTLDPVFGFPQFVRFGWSTAAIILQDKAVPVRWDDDEDENDKRKKDDIKNVPSITSFFQASSADGAATKPVVKHRFFTERCLKQVTDL